MRVLIDLSLMHGFSKQRGIGVYANNLYKALRTLNQKDFQIDLNQDPNPDYGQYDLVHFPFFDLFFNTLPYRLLNKSLVTVHDLIPIRFKNNYPPGIRGGLRFLWQRFKLKRSLAVITDSKASKKDLIKLFKLKQDKVFPIYLAGNNLTKTIDCSKLKERLNLPDNYLLYIGDVNYHKNLKSLIRALKYLPKKINLVLAGSGFVRDSVEKAQIEALITKLKLKNRIKILGYLKANQLSTVYQLADFYIQPSLWEGFGLPVIEALSLGVPVIVSRNSSLREITNDTVAFYIKYPFNGKKIAEAIKQAYKGKPKIDKDKLTKFANQFSWDKTAWQTYQVYKKVYEKQI